MNILLTAFNESKNSSKVLLDLITSKRNVDELYLDNKSHRYESQLKDQLSRKHYQLILSFEQHTMTDTIYVTVAGEGTNDVATASAISLVEYLRQKQYKAELCRYSELPLEKSTYGEGLDIPMLILYIPSIGKIDILKLAKICSQYFNTLIENGK